MRSLLILTTFIIFVLGVVMIFSTSSAEVLDHDLDKSTHWAPLRQLYFACGALVLAYAAWKGGYRRILRWSPFLLLICTFLLILVLIPGIGKQVHGSKRWLNVAGVSFQPSEFLKYLLPAYLIHWLSLRSVREISAKAFLRLVVLMAVPIVLVMIEPNNGTAAVIGLTMIIVCLLTGIPLKYFAWPVLGLIVVGGVFAWQLPYVSARLKVYLHPESDLQGKGHQPYQAKIAAGSGKLFGRGPGNSLQKLSYLPEAQNDYIAAIYAEEFGFLGILGLICSYALIGYAGFVLSSSAEDAAGLYLGGTITFLLCFQAFLNLAVVSGLLPSTGLNLPFFSQGGSSLLANAMGIGLLLSIKSQEEHNEQAYFNSCRGNRGAYLSCFSGRTRSGGSGVRGVH